MGRKTKMNHITSPELLEQVNPKNKRLFKEFLDYLRSVDRSETTIDAYRHDLQIVGVFLLQNCDNKFFVDMTKRDVVAFQNWLLNDHENSAARVRRLKAALSSLSNFIEDICDDEYPGYRSVVRKIENPVNTPTREKTVLSDDQVDSLLDTLTKKGEYEKACCFALASYSGRRKAELFRFKVSDFSDDNLMYGSLYKSAPIKTKGRGKAGKMLTCYTLAKPFKPYFDAWMKYREENGIDSIWLFPDPSDSDVPRDSDIINSWTRTATSILGVDVYAHSFRHRACTRLAECGIPDDVIQKLFGWSSLDLVNVYKDIDPLDNLAEYFANGEIKAAKKKELGDL